MPAAAGRLDQWVTFERPPAATSQGAFGEPNLGPWITVVQEWCEVLDLGGAELVAAQQTKATITARIRTRWRTDLDATMRASWRGRVLYFEALLMEGQEEILVILCREKR